MTARAIFRAETGDLVRVPGVWLPARITVSTSAVGVGAIPSGYKILRLLVTVIGQPINWSGTSGTVPTSGKGNNIPAGQTFVYDGDPDDLSMIRDAAATGDATVQIEAYGIPV